MYEILDRPQLHDPVLIVTLDGWIDAGLAAAGTATHLQSTCEVSTVATFDTDLLLDHRARRPMMHIDDGEITSLTWPHLELRSGTDAAGHDVLFLVGSEPDHQWRAFADAVVGLALEFGVRLAVDLGAYPAPVAHTHPIGVVATATTPELAAAVGHLPGRVDVPAGIAAVLARRCAEAGIPAVGLWAQVPHYASAIPAPAASLAHLAALERVAGLHFPTGDLPRKAAATTEHINALVAANPEHIAMVADLERRPPATEGGASISGDDLVAEVEEFLRDEGS
jgi:hypothetical protein